MSKPDVTKVQAFGASALVLLGSGIALASAFGVTLTNTQITAITGFATAFVSVAVAADAYIRNGRAKIEAAKAMPKPAAKK
jgi:hypothetical protein